MKNLTSRIISALVAVIILFSTIYFFEKKGVYAILLFVVFRCSYEINRMIIKSQYPKVASYIFIITNLLSFIALTQSELQSVSIFFVLLTFVVNTILGIVLHKQFKDLDSIFSFISKACFSSLYSAVIPASVYWMLKSEHGMVWFYFLLAIVFAGDIGAYLSGVTMGKRKIAPLLSPNKSVEGSIGGLFFSALTAYLFSVYLIPQVPMWTLVLCGLIGGMLGQIGDLFESLIKRISGVKDSGTIMPGHGGVLDRIDGVLLAAPLVYLLSQFF